MLDTGSTDTWVASSACQSCNQSVVMPYIDGSRPSFNSAQSSTFRATNHIANLSYADGSSSLGTIVSDTLTLGMCPPSLPPHSVLEHSFLRLLYSSKPNLHPRHPGIRRLCGRRHLRPRLPLALARQREPLVVERARPIRAAGDELLPHRVSALYLDLPISSHLTLLFLLSHCPDGTTPARAETSSPQAVNSP